MINIYYYIAIGFSLVLLVWMVFLTFRQQRMHKKFKTIFQSSDKDNLYELITGYMKEVKTAQEYAGKVENELRKITSLMKKSIQKVGFLRYNPFGNGNTGGNQSFSVAVLDYDNNGFILTSIHGREGTRVYAKPIKNGLSAHNLSKEEEASLKKAINKE